MIGAITTLLIDHKTGTRKTWWDQDIPIEHCDDDVNGYYLITVPTEDDYFMIDPYDIVIFRHGEEDDVHAGIVTFKDYCDKKNLIIKVKSFLRC